MRSTVDFDCRTRMFERVNNRPGLFAYLELKTIRDCTLTKLLEKSRDFILFPYTGFAAIFIVAQFQTRNTKVRIKIMAREDLLRTKR